MFPQLTPPGQQNKPSSTAPAQPLPNVGQWDYKTASRGMHGEALPQGAQGWAPGGTPFFGEGIGNKIREYTWMFTKDIPQVDTSVWQDIKDHWQKALSQPAPKSILNQTPEQLQQSRENAQLIGETASRLWQAGSAQGSFVSPLLRGVNVTVKAIGDLFSLPAQYAERAGGVLQAFTEEVDKLNPAFQMDDNPFTKGLQYTPLGIGINLARTIASSDPNKWNEMGKAVSEGWQSGRIFYSQAFDQTIREEFLRRYRGGENPELLAMELQNPWAELGGQLILDPTNLLSGWGKAARLTKEIDTASELVKTGGILRDAKVAEAFDALGKGVSDAKALETWKDTVLAAQKTVVENVEGNRLLHNTFTAGALTQGSRVKLVLQNSSDVIGLLVGTLRHAGMSFDDVAEGVRVGVQSVSRNEDEMQLGLTGLAHLPSAHLWVNENAVQTWITIRNLVTDEKGALNGARLERLLGKKDLVSFADEAKNLLVAATKNQFPDVQEMKKASGLVEQALKEGGTVGRRTQELASTYKNLSPAVKALDELNNIASKPKNFVNKFLSLDYFGLRGGTAVKNAASNYELILADEGIGAFFKETSTGGVGFWSTKAAENYLTDVFGFEPSATTGFETLAGSEGRFKKFGAGVLMDKGETAAAKRIVASATRNVLKEMLQPGKALPSLDVLKATGMTDRQATQFAKFIYQFHGDTEKAMGAFRELYGTGSADAWRHLDFLTGYQQGALEQMGYQGTLEEFARTGGHTTQEVEDFFAHLRQDVLNKAGEAVKDPIRMSGDSKLIDQLSYIDEAVKAGFGNEAKAEVLKAVLQASQNARNEYMFTLEQHMRLLTQQLAEQGKTRELQKLNGMWEPLFQGFMEDGSRTAQKTGDMLASTRAWYEEIQALKKPTPEELASYWKRANLAGEPPLDLTRKTLMSELWDQHRANVSTEWNTYFDALFNQSDELVKEMGKLMDTTTLEAGFARSRQAVAKVQAYREAVYSGGRLKTATAANISAEDAAKLQAEYDELSKSVNKIAATKEEQVAAQGAARRMAEIDNILRPVMSIPPPMTNGLPSFAGAWNENAKGALYMLDEIKNNILDGFGQRVSGGFDPQIEGALRDYASSSQSRIDEAKAVALKIATEHRNFSILNYGERTYSDVAFSYVLPYHFFYSRNYSHLFQRLAYNPDIVAGYAKFKRAMEAIHAGLPDWYKQQININPFAGTGARFLGIPVDHPLFINLEASINPIYGLTGTDFNDPQKRTDWFTSSVDDLGKFGPSLWAPLQMAMAAHLAMKGQTDAASRWGGRFFPITQELKTASSFLPFLKKPVELDPAVQLFSGGIDSYERSRVGTQLLNWANGQIAQIKNDPSLTPSEKDQAIGNIQAQIDDAAYSQSGDLWDQAYKDATQNRWPTVAGGWLLGVGFKPRSEADVQVQQMNQDMQMLFGVADTMTPEQYRVQWDTLREKYPAMDAILLSRKGGDARDSAFAYNVLGRLPPGNTTKVLEAIGLTTQDISKFYDSKGFTKPGVTFTDTEKQRFMAAILDLGAMLNVPPDATRQEWTAARNAYSQAQNEIKTALGVDIFDKVNMYYDLKNVSQPQADQFRTQHPEIQQALNGMQKAKVSNPLLSAYYGGLDTIDSYLGGKNRAILTQRYGQNIYKIQEQYYNIKIASPGQARQFLGEHPELKKFWKDKAALDEQANHQFISLANKIPSVPGVGIRPGFTPQSGAQKGLLQAVQGEEPMTWKDFQAIMPPQLQARVIAYWTQNAELSKAASSELDFLAQKYNFYNGDALLRRAGLSLFNQ